MLTYQQLIKTFLCSLVAVIALFSFTSCGDSNTVTTYELASMDTKPTQTTKENDTRFLVRAVEMRYEQILLHKLAQQRTSNEALRAVAASLEQANRDAKSALASLGFLKSIKVPAAPTPSAQAAYDTLNTAGVEIFDATYIAAVIEGYQEAIRQFETAGSAQIDPEINAKVTAMLPDMRAQLTKVLQMNANNDALSMAD